MEAPAQPRRTKPPATPPERRGPLVDEQNPDAVLLMATYTYDAAGHLLGGTASYGPALAPPWPDGPLSLPATYSYNFLPPGDQDEDAG